MIMRGRNRRLPIGCRDGIGIHPAVTMQIGLLVEMSVSQPKENHAEPQSAVKMNVTRGAGTELDTVAYLTTAGVLTTNNICVAPGHQVLMTTGENNH
jgi:hypothetical protein